LGQINNIRVIILVLCFALTSFIIYQDSPSKVVSKKVSLNQALSDIKGWKRKGLSPLDKNIIEALKLDDYINQNYTSDFGSIFLYIGHYFTSKNVGAAHDPLVCFPGQGWQLIDKQKGKLDLNHDADKTISYSMMTAKHGQQKELVVYWFQSYKETSPDTLSQKITTLWEKVLDHGEDNAFVRITTPIGNRSISECKETIFKFIRAFYPVFLNYIEE